MIMIIGNRYIKTWQERLPALPLGLTWPAASKECAMQAEIDDLRAALGMAKRLTERYRQETRWQGGRIRELTDELANRDAKLAALEKQEPVAYRFPKAGVDNGYNYCDSLGGEEPRFLKLWEKLYAAAKFKD